ncbi:Ultraviolet-B receptor UVR8 [Dendrobium catenatum]|uniref:Ultraviolet-B receptor UVR8 n=1 Tax=Dendrobium catenatum TaxID=906689 RepID=A0A2I0XBX3_9ASPA|nr:Ultraviolet-B receptor UVR8 [Dendrobium catenatum]
MPCDLGTSMADARRNSPFDRDVEQAITALKKGSCLLKYGRRGKPKFCPFRLSADESMLIWFAGRQEKTLVLGIVSKIIPGQRTAIFQRYPQPDKEYQSFSLIYKDRSLDLICKDKDEAEVWYVGLKALISCRNHLKRLESKADRLSDSSSSKSTSYKQSPSNLPFNPENRQPVGLSALNPPANGFGSVFSDVILYTAHTGSFQYDSVSNSLSSAASADNSNGRGSTSENFRVSLSSAVSSSSHGSGHRDFDTLGDAFIWGESIGDGLLGAKSDASLPKALESTVILDVNSIACGSKHAALVTKQGEVFTWGEESGGRLGHAIDADVSQPKLVNALSGMNVEFVACGEYHTCALTFSGDLYTWGDGVYNSGLLGHGSEASHWVPKLVTGQMGALHVSSVSCGPWHTAVVTSLGQLFTFGDGTFGALGHGNRTSINVPREVEALIGLRTISTACGVWHTAAVVEMESQPTDSDSYISRKLFTWGDGDEGRLGHGDKEHRLVPACVVSLTERNICQVACGDDITVALTASGRVYTLGSTIYGQIGNPQANGNIPTVVEGKLSDSIVEQISCGSHHVAVLTSKNEVYTWGKGTNGQLGHGDNENRDIPTLVKALKDKQVKSVACGSNFTAVICLHKWISGIDRSVCSGCHLPFGFRRQRHNCYNCAQVFCKSCTSRKSIRAALAPNIHKQYRVCDACYNQLRKSESGIHSLVLKQQNASQRHISTQMAEEMVVSRHSSASSFKGESRHPRQSEKSESNHNPMSLVQNECFQRGNIQKPKSKNIIIRSPITKCSASVPGSQLVCRSMFPLGVSLVSLLPGTISTGLVSAEVPIDELKKTNESLREEVAQLKLQLECLTQKFQNMESEFERKSVELKEAIAKAAEENAKCKAAEEVIKSLTSQLECLTQKFQNMESEFERKSVELKEAIAKAAEENAKCKAAEEVIKSLTSQLKDMAERAPEVCINDHSHSDVSYASNELKLNLSGTRLNHLLSKHSQDSNGHISDSLPSIASDTSEGVEWVEQAEAGVYITVSSSPCGAKILKKIRFSRKRFSEERAESWWAENRQKLQDKYIFPAAGVGSLSMKKNSTIG